MDIPAVIDQLGASSQGLVTSAQLTAAGVSRGGISRAVARREIVRVRRGVYARTALPELPQYLVTDKGPAAELVLLVRAVLLSIGSGAAACGRTAAALRGWGLLVEPRLVDVAVPHGSGTRHKGVLATQRRSALRSRVRVLPGTSRLRMTSRVQTSLDCAVTLPLLEAVVAVDSALRSGKVTLEELRRAAERLPGVEGVARARQILSLSDPLAGSVLESVLRVQFVLAGLEGFRTQAVLSTWPALRVDFCFDSARLVVEVDGVRWHTDAARDQARDNQLAVLGWRVLRFSWGQVVHSPEEVLADIRAALAVVPTIQSSGEAPAQAA